MSSMDERMQDKLFIGAVVAVVTVVFLLGVLVGRLLCG
mgnify:CR=1 FL=1